MLKVDVLGEGAVKFYDDRFDGYHVLVEKKSMGVISGVSGPTAWGMVYLVLPENGPHALDYNEALLLADALTCMLKAGADIAALMGNAQIDGS